MKKCSFNPWSHRVAVLTTCLALLPIGMGALVTTKDAGMAFPDWPTSDGEGMFAYPWLKSAGDKFLEHGHRLAGIVIGLASIGLALALCQADRRSWVRGLGFAVLAGVIGQGILGGQRVLLDARGLAFLHGSVAALVFALLAAVAVVTSRGWHEQATATSDPALDGLKVLPWATCAAVFVQYVLGGLLRHQGTALYEHLGFAIVAALLVVLLAVLVAGSGIRWLRGPTAILALLTIAQLALGAGAWITKFGFGEYVAVYGSTLQVSIRTAHVLVGMLLFAATVVTAVRIARVRWVQARTGRTVATVASIAAGLPATGGAR